MYYLIGSSDPGMISLALFLEKLGYIVCCHESEKTEMFSHVFTSKSRHGSVTVIKGQYVLDDDPILVEAKKLNLKIHSYFEIINFLVNKHKTIVVFEQDIYLSSLLNDVLNEFLGSNCLIKEKKVEASKTNPYLLLNVDLNNYNLLEKGAYYSIIDNPSVGIETFILNNKEFLNKTRKIIIAQGDRQKIPFEEITKPFFLYGIEQNNDITARNIEASKTGYVFDVYVEDNYYGHFDFPLKNKDDLNAIVAVIAICCYERFASKDVSRILKKLLKKRP